MRKNKRKDQQLWTARSTFKEAALGKPGTCTACGKFHEAGAEVLLKTYQSRMNSRQTNRVILCDDRCWQEYDWNYWEARADTHDIRADHRRTMRMHEKAESEGYGYSSSLVASARKSELDELEREEEREAMRNYEV